MDLFVYDGEGYLLMDPRKKFNDYPLPPVTVPLLIEARLPELDFYIIVENIEWKKYLLDVRKDAKLKDIEEELKNIRNL